MQDLFSSQEAALSPLADRMRPRTLDEFIGQGHIVGPGRLLRRAIEADRMTSSIFYGPPGCGKTTLLRDMTRALSMRGIKVAVCDERSEIAGMYDSVPSFDLGPRTDVLDGCDKTRGIAMLIRSMSPQVIVTDEMGRQEDIDAVYMCGNAGVSLITSVHGNDENDVLRSGIGSLVQKKVFKNVIYLSSERGPGRPSPTAPSRSPR